MLIAHLIGGVILIASFLLRMPQTSSTISLFLTAFKSVTPVSFLEDVFSFSPAFVDSSSFYSDVAFSSSPAVTDLVVYYPPSQYSASGSAANVDVSAEIVVQAGDEENPMSTPAAYFNIFLFLVPPCAILTLYLTYVSPRRLDPRMQF